MIPERLIAFGLALFLTLAAVVIQLEGLNFLSWVSTRPKGAHRLLLSAVICGIIMLHVLEATLFALGYWLGDAVLHLGKFVGAHALTPIFYFYFAAETFTTQSFGDVYPLGSLRMIASIEPLTGLILIGWSTSFTFLLMNNYWAAARGRGQRQQGRRSAP